jgi:hypothetical protein
MQAAPLKTSRDAPASDRAAAACLGAAVHDQLARFDPGEIAPRQHRFQLRHRLARQFSQRQQARRGPAVDVGPAVRQEGRDPAPLLEVELGTQAQGTVFLEQPAQRLDGHAGIGQGRDVAVA